MLLIEGLRSLQRPTYLQTPIGGHQYQLRSLDLVGQLTTARPDPRTRTPDPDQLWAIGSAWLCLSRPSGAQAVLLQIISPSCQPPCPPSCRPPCSPSWRPSYPSYLHVFFYRYWPAAPAVKTPVGAVAKTHRIVRRPQEVVSSSAACQNFLTDQRTRRF